jgi:signal transduction histidine kinase
VTASFGESGIEIAIEDDGRGFDVRKVFEHDRKDRHMGLGLLGMEERVALLDGKLSIRSEPGTGTRIDVFIPVPT